MNLPELNQVLNVSFQYYENWNTVTSKSMFGHTKLNFDLNYMCPYCKNEDTNLVQDTTILNIYHHVFKKCSFWKMIHCSCCTATFFTFKLKEICK